MMEKVKLNNPFVVYGYKGPEYFCDREAETEKLMSTLHSERNVTLIAPRRMGKTGLIQHAFNRFSAIDKDIKCFYIDIFATKNLEQLVQLLANEIIGKLETVSQAALRNIQAFFSSFRPTVTLDELTGIPTFSLDIQPSEREASLKRIFEYMKASGRRCYVAIDEFQQILSYPEKGTEALIRSYIQFLPNVYFIFSGSRQHMMEEMFLSANRPFFQSSMVMSLQPIDEAKYLSFANEMLQQDGRTIDADVFHYIYDVSEGITWYIQSILHGIYDHHRVEIDKALVDDVIQESIGEQTATYQNYLAWLTENQQNLLRAVASEHLVEAPLSQDFIRTHHLPAPSSVKTALNALVDKQLITRTPKGYSVSDLFFAMWLRKL
jgi:AAA+ ATPase superfamily predicted ATPase